MGSGVKGAELRRLTEKHVDEHFAQAIEDNAEENGCTTDGRVERQTDAGGHESGREDEDPAID